MSCCCWTTIFIGGVAALLAVLKMYMKLTTGWCRSQTCLVGKTALITGANTGLGYETALDLAKRGARVILACRSEEKANEAKNKIIKATDNQNIIVKLVDFESLTSVRKFAEDINKTEERLDILINNAGMVGAKDKLTEDSLQYGTQINYFGPFLLTNLLIDLLKKSGPSRVVNVSSRAAMRAKFNLDKLNNFNGSMVIYPNSKLCNVLFTIELANRLKGTQVTTYSLHPGVVLTDIFKNLPAYMRIPIEFIIRNFLKNVTEGAQTQIYLATAKGIENFTGEYFEDCKHQELFENATQDPTLPRKLWDKTEKLVKLTSKDKQL